MSFPLPSSRPAVPCVLYINDAAADRQVFLSAFQREFKVLVAAGLDDALSLLEQHHVHVVISDPHRAGVAGCTVLQHIRAAHPQVRRMLVTAQCDLQAIVDALNEAGVCFYIQKPWEAAEVRRAVLRAFAEANAEAERTAYTDQLVETNKQLEFALRQRLLS